MKHPYDRNPLRLHYGVCYAENESSSRISRSQLATTTLPVQFDVTVLAHSHTTLLGPTYNTMGNAGSDVSTTPFAVL